MCWNCHYTGEGIQYPASRVELDFLVISILYALLNTIIWRVQAAYTMCNIAAHGDSFCTMLLDEGALKEVIPLFRSTDPDTVHYALSFCEMLLHSSSTVSTVCVYYCYCCLRLNIN